MWSFLVHTKFTLYISALSIYIHDIFVVLCLRVQFLCAHNFVVRQGIHVNGHNSFSHSGDQNWVWCRFVVPDGWSRAGRDEHTTHALTTGISLRWIPNFLCTFSETENRVVKSPTGICSIHLIGKTADDCQTHFVWLIFPVLFQALADYNVLGGNLEQTHEHLFPPFHDLTAQWKRRRIHIQVYGGCNLPQSNAIFLTQIIPTPRAVKRYPLCNYYWIVNFRGYKVIIYTALCDYLPELKLIGKISQFNS